MKNLRKDNKGFSLVELIVVVLIMAIIAVALAPQVMKWVNNSRITADQNAAGNIKAAVQSGYADYLAKGNPKAGDSFTFKGVFNDTTTTLRSCIKDALGGENYTPKYSVTTGHIDGFSVVLTENGAVTVTCDASSASLE